MYCIKCGNPVDDTTNFCTKCGNRIERDNITPVMVNNSVSASTPPTTNTTTNTNTNTNTPISSSNISKKKFDINKILIVCIVLVCLFILIGACIKILNGNSKRVVMIYMVGSNLESDSGLATNDLNYIDYEKTKKNNTEVILMAGGTKVWNNNYVNVNETSIYRLGPSGYEKIDARSMNNMGDNNNLSYFLNYVYKNYRASKYNFIYWNHGGAVDGSEYDDITKDHLKLQEMVAAFENSPFKNHKIDTISFRTCLNSTIEVANIYKKYAKYLIASEEVTMGSGYDSALRFLNDIKTTDSPVEFGKKEINNYKETVSIYCNRGSDYSENYCYNSTYSITDLSKIDNVIKEMDKVAKELNTNLSKNSTDYIKLRSTLNQYGADDPGYDMVDLFNLSQVYDKYTKRGNAFRKVIEEAVVYNWSTNNYSHGLSVYFPYNRSYFLEDYKNISTSNSYTGFITNFYSAKSGIKINSYNNFSSIDSTVNKKSKDSVDVGIQLSEEQINNMAKSDYIVYVDTKDGYQHVLYNGEDIKIEGNKLKASVKERIIKICDKEFDDCAWITAIEEESNDDYIDMKADIFLSKTRYFFGGKQAKATAIIRIDDKHPNGYIKNVYLDSKEQSQQLAVLSKTGIKMTDYPFATVLNLHYKVVDENGNYNENWDSTSNANFDGGTFRTNLLKLEKEKFDDNYDYYLLFRIKDIANNNYYSKPVKIN